MQKLITVFSTCVLLLAGAGVAAASEGEALPWGNFLLRVVNAAIFVGIIWYFAGGMIKKFFAGRSGGIAQKLDDLAQMRKDATVHLSAIEQRVANLDAECAAILAESKAQAERIREGILADARKQAAQILEQAERSADLAAKVEASAIRARLADDIVSAMEKELAHNMDAARHQKLIDNSLTKVVLQ